MRSLYNYIISTKNRYNNSKAIEDKELILNTEITERDYQFVNRIGKVISVPILYKNDISVGDEVILHHNVFRRWIDVRGNEKNSSSFIQENEYFVAPDQIYAYKKDKDWLCLNEYCFVKPLQNESKWEPVKEKKLLGELVYSNAFLKSLGLAIGDVVGFTPDSEYEFNINNQKLYRILSNQVTLKYGSTQKNN